MIWYDTYSGRHVRYDTVCRRTCLSSGSPFSFKEFQIIQLFLFRWSEACVEGIIKNNMHLLSHHSTFCQVTSLNSGSWQFSKMTLSRHPAGGRGGDWWWSSTSLGLHFKVWWLMCLFIPITNRLNLPGRTLHQLQYAAVLTPPSWSFSSPISALEK